MSNKIGMELFQGAKNLDPSHFVGERDLRDIHVGIEHGPSGTTYNRLALPWSGAAYTLVDGDWVQIAGRPGAMTGEELENSYPNLAQVWRQFARAQNDRQSNPGTFESLKADLGRVAAQLNEVGQMGEGEGISLRDQKLARKRGNIAQSMSGMEAVTDGGRPVEGGE